MRDPSPITAKHRLHVDAKLATGDRVELDSERAHYLVRVLRLRSGDAVVAFNGDGGARYATLVAASTKRCELEIGELIATQPEPAFSLGLVQALIKGDKLDFVLQKATELGVTDITLITSERTEVMVRDERLERRLAHWQKIIVAAAEQCGRLRLPTLHAPQSIEDAMTSASGRRFLLDPGAAPIPTALEPESTQVWVGPEGGFSDAERDRLLSAGFIAMGLGSIILRADTAPVAALAILRNGWVWRLP